MRTIVAIIVGVVCIIAAIIVQYFRAPVQQAPSASAAMTIPEPSQMWQAEYTSSLIKLLQRSDPGVWHQVAMGWNWDGGVAPLDWMNRQPQCDRGTALLIYWRSGPGFFKQYASRDEVPAYVGIELFDLQEELESRFSSDFYSRREIAFDPRNDDGYDWTTRYDDEPAKRKIPEQLYEATSGREIRKACVYLQTGLRC